MSESHAAAIPANEVRAGTIKGLRATVKAHPYFTIFTLALFVRIFIAVASTVYFSGFVLDDETYNFMATDVAAGDTEHWDPFTWSLYWRTFGFLGPVTLIYKVFGPVKLAGQIFVAFLGAGAATLVVRLLKEFMTTRWAMVGGLTVAFLPSQAFWSAMLMKDAAVWLALLGAALAVAVAGRSEGRHLLLCGVGVAASLVALSFLREHTLVVVTWAVMIGSVAGIARQRLQRVLGAVVLGLTIPWLVASIGPAGIALITAHGSLAERRFYNAMEAETAVVDVSRPPPGSGLVPPAVREEAAELTTEATEREAQATTLDSLAAESQADAEALARARARARAQARAERLAARAERLRAQADAEALARWRARAQARGERLAARAERLRAQANALKAAAETLVAEATPPDASLDPNLAHLPRGLSVMLLEPFPVPFTGSSSHRLARLESLLWYPLLILAGIGLWQARRYLRVLLMPLLTGGGILMTYALTEGNVGTAHRHRGEFVWVVVVLAVLGLRHLLTGRASRKAA